MNYFSVENLDLDGQDFEVIKSDYWSHIESIRDRLLPKLYELHRNYSLHDCEIISVLPLRGGEDLAITLEGVINGPIADTDHCVYFLHFISCDSVSFAHLFGREIHTVEVDVQDNGASVLRILHRDSECNYSEDAIVFSNFDFYIKNSRCP